MEVSAIIDIVKIYGPMGIGWVIAAYLGKFVMDRYDRDIDSRVKLATSLESLVKAVEEIGRERAK